jgi:predicted helicase
MRRAVAFCQTIATSRKITETFNVAADEYISALPPEKRETMQTVVAMHIDGSMDATKRNDLLSWLKDEPEEGECRVLTNVRCLSEGVDVPSLDAVMFLSAKNSQVEVVQSVGRVMRKAPNKRYGYIIIPVFVPAAVEADKALDDNERYKVVWTVLNALRAHDDRFNATVNKIELNRNKPQNILVGRPDVSFDADGNPVITAASETSRTTSSHNDAARQLALQFEQLQSVVFARMVQKVGDKRYWEQWAKSVAEIAERQIERITRMVGYGEIPQFTDFLTGLQKNINPSITAQEAIEMLSQHIITKPVFEALFEGYSFVGNNPVSVSMQGMLDLLEDKAFDKDTETLQKFYESVKMRASGIDNAEGKQRIIIELYDKFFKTAFPRMVERLGIVYTPVEVVDFIIHSVDDVLRKEFGRSLSDENVNILDPFTGTGTFINRLIQSGLIRPQDLQRKYSNELFANEIVLLAYYIAAVNIENAYHDAVSFTAKYEPFPGICLTDTFQLTEDDDDYSELFPHNSELIIRQKGKPLTVITGNPPYSIGQKSANDNAQNQEYPKLNRRIEETYARQSNAGLNKSLYDAYIKAFRWAADRLGNNDGVIAFVTNGAWLDGNSTDGFRKCLEQEFDTIYVFNLRGNQRTSGELSRREGGKIFGSGSRTPISITLLVKRHCLDSQSPQNKATIHYHDIGDYLTREQKLAIVRQNRSIANMQWQQLAPNEHGDWLNLRNDAFSSFIPLEPKKKFDTRAKSFFLANIVGVATGRDAWVFNFSKEKLADNMRRMIDFFNEQSADYARHCALEPQNRKDVEDFIDTNPAKISWTVNLKKDIENGKQHTYNADSYKIAMYRPFTKSWLYYDRAFIERPGLWPQLFPTKEHKNLVICLSCAGSSKDLSAIITDTYSDYHFAGDTQCFPLYYYEENNPQQGNLFETANENKYIRRDAVSDFILQRAKQQYGISHLRGEGGAYQRRHFLLPLRLPAQPAIPRDLCRRPQKDAAPPAVG